jgi:hypothetical protein
LVPALAHKTLSFPSLAFVTLKMLKEYMATETEGGAKDEAKRRKQPPRGTAAAEQAGEEQNKQTPQVPNFAESYERYNRELAQHMDRKSEYLVFLIPQCNSNNRRNGKTQQNTNTVPDHQ